jgi:hypothetical protein
MKAYNANILKTLNKHKGKLEGYSGRNFENGKAEKKIQSRIVAPSSAKNPAAALKESMAAFDAATSMIDTRMTAAIAQAKRAYTTESLDKVPAALNRVLEAAADISSKHSVNSKYTTIKVEVEIKKVTPETVSKMSVDKFKRTSVTSSYDNSLKVASAAEIDDVAATILKASRIFSQKLSEVMAFAELMIGLGKTMSVSSSKTASKAGAAHGIRVNHGETGIWNFIKIDTAYRYAMYTCSYVSSSVEMGLAEGVYRNASACVAWAQASIAEAKKMAKAQN